MRKFKHFEGQFGQFVSGTADRLQLELDGGEAVPQLGLLGGKRLLVQFVVDSHVDESALLFHQQGLLPRQFLVLSQSLGLLILRLRPQHRPEPVGDFRIDDLHPTEQVEHLAVELGFGNPVAGMAGFVVAGTAVIDVRAFAGAGLLRLAFTGDRVAAVRASNQFPGIGHRMGVIDAAVHDAANTVPGCSIDQRFVLTGIPLTTELNLADVGSVLQNVVDRTSRERRRRRAEHPPFDFQLHDQLVERQRLPSVEVKDPLYVLGGHRINLDDTASFFANVAIAIGSLANEPAFLDAASESLADIDRLLLGVEAGHVGQGSPHHAARRRHLSGLADRDERNIVL